MEREQFSVRVICPGCGQRGLVRWSENGPTNRQRGAERELLGMTEGFHSETGRTQSGDPLIVCDACDRIQPD